MAHSMANAVSALTGSLFEGSSEDFHACIYVIVRHPSYPTQSNAI